MEWCDEGSNTLNEFLRELPVVVEERLADLAQSTNWMWPTENHALAAEAAHQVADFREQTVDWLETLDDLTVLEGVEMESMFCPSVYGIVEDNREESIDALEYL